MQLEESSNHNNPKAEDIVKKNMSEKRESGIYNAKKVGVEN